MERKTKRYIEKASLIAYIFSIVGLWNYYFYFSASSCILYGGCEDIMYYLSFVVFIVASVTYVAINTEEWVG